MKEKTKVKKEYQEITKEQLKTAIDEIVDGLVVIKSTQEHNTEIIKELKTTYNLDSALIRKVAKVLADNKINETEAKSQEFLELLQLLK